MKNNHIEAGSKKVTRYNLRWDNASAWMMEHHWGEYVTYASYQALKRRITTLKRKVTHNG